MRGVDSLVSSLSLTGMFWRGRYGFDAEGWMFARGGSLLVRKDFGGVLDARVQ